MGREKIKNKKNNLFDHYISTKFFIYQDAATILTDHYFLVLLDLALLLGGNRIKTPATGIPFDRYNS